MRQYEFDRAIALNPTGDASVATAVIDDAWRIGNGINGGVLMAIGALALRRVLDEDGRHPDPLALSAYFLTPPQTGELSVATQVLRAGRTMSTGQFVLSQPDQDGRPQERMRGLATFGDLTERAHPLVRSEPPPDMPSVDECLASPQRGSYRGIRYTMTSTLLERVDLRLDPACAGWLHGEPSHEGVIRGWLRLADGRPPDVLSLLWALDAMPPVAFDLGLIGWTPTLEFTGHLRAHPAPGWLQIVTTTANVAGGLMEEDARIWDSTGRLVALSRQLCAWRPTEPG
ncbi:MAG: thioesterase family protein [Dermatophilaceae bacterium]